MFLPCQAVISVHKFFFALHMVKKKSELKETNETFSVIQQVCREFQFIYEF